MVPTENLLEGNSIAICCAHGDTVVYPLARVQVEVNGTFHEVEAAVSRTLPLSMLMGTDVPALPELVKNRLGDRKEKESALMVVTRAKKRAQEREEAVNQLEEEESGVHSSSVDPEDGTGLPNFDDDLFRTVREKPVLTRSEIRAQRCDYRDDVARTQGATNQVASGTDEFEKAQQEDLTLKSIRKSAQTNLTVTGCGFFVRNRLVYRRWIPCGRDEEVEQLVLPLKYRPRVMKLEQLVLPLKYRPRVMKLAHKPPFAGHLGRDKTVTRIMWRFYWPTMFADVSSFIKTCVECQKTAPRGGNKAPLIPLHIISEPFRRIAMDIVGPLPRSRSGKRFILVICDYATRFPEAIPMKSVDALHVAQELLVYCSRFGVPREILTDQGANFTSKLLSELYGMLHIHLIRTTPYHPHTDGLVERFNKTLKSMLRKAAIYEGKDWDKMVPYLLFAYREVEQSSTGFSPFELVYGRSVCGPLDVLKEMWEAEEDTSESVVSYVLTIQDRLQKMKELMAENLREAQQTQKQWYDKRARMMEFNVVDKVLLLLPTESKKLFARWQGPYKVVSRIGKVNCQVEMAGRR